MGPTIEEQRERIRQDNRPAKVNHTVNAKCKVKINANWIQDLIDLSEVYAENLRKNATPQEKLIYEFLRNYNIYFKFQHPFFIHNSFYILDFYLPFYKVALEIDGNQHYTIEGKKKDKIRDNDLRKKRIKTIRIANHLVNDFDKIYLIFKDNGLFDNKPIITKPRKLNRKQRNKRWKKFAKNLN